MIEIMNPLLRLQSVWAGYITRTDVHSHQFTPVADPPPDTAPTRRTTAGRRDDQLAVSPIGAWHLSYPNRRDIIILLEICLRILSGIMSFPFLFLWCLALLVMF